MPEKHEQAEQMREYVPSTVARSDDKAVRTYKKTPALPAPRWPRR